MGAGVQSSSAMRNALYVLAGAVAMLVIVGYRLVAQPVPVPEVASGIDPACVAAMRQSAPDLTWTAPGRNKMVRTHAIATVSPGQVAFHDRERVRVLGMLLLAGSGHLLAFQDQARERESLLGVPSVNFRLLWPGEPYWLTKAPSVSGRCVVVEGTVSLSAAGGEVWSAGVIDDVVRLDVWSEPHRPLVRMPRRPPLGGAERDARTTLLTQLRRFMRADGAGDSVATFIGSPAVRAAIVSAIGDGEQDWLEVAGGLRPRAGTDVAATLKRGVQLALAVNAADALRLVASGAFSAREVCRTDALTPTRADEIATPLNTYDAVLAIDMRIGGVSDVDDAILAPVIAQCIAELRREREAVLAEGE